MTVYSGVEISGKISCKETGAFNRNRKQEISVFFVTPQNSTVEANSHTIIETNIFIKTGIEKPAIYIWKFWLFWIPFVGIVDLKFLFLSMTDELIDTPPSYHFNMLSLYPQSIVKIASITVNMDEQRAKIQTSKYRSQNQKKSETIFWNTSRETKKTRWNFNSVVETVQENLKLEYLEQNTSIVVSCW